MLSMISHQFISSLLIMFHLPYASYCSIRNILLLQLRHWKRQSCKCIWLKVQHIFYRKSWWHLCVRLCSPEQQPTPPDYRLNRRLTGSRPPISPIYTVFRVALHRVYPVCSWTTRRVFRRRANHFSPPNRGDGARKNSRFQSSNS